MAICGALNVQADVIDADQARVIASEFLSNRHDGTRINNGVAADLTLSRTRFSSAQQEKPVYYVFADENHGGWVMVSADDRAVQVLGYSESGSFDINAMPCNMRSWLDGYSSQIEYLQAHPAIKGAAKALAMLP